VRQRFWARSWVCPNARHRSISTGSSCRLEDLSNLFAFFGATLGGWLGWWLGEYVGFMTAFIVSVFGSAIGVYVGRRVVDNLLA
jgi:hypothetical protein